EGHAHAAADVDRHRFEGRQLPVERGADCARPAPGAHRLPPARDGRLDESERRGDLRHDSESLLPAPPGALHGQTGQAVRPRARPAQGRETVSEGHPRTPQLPHGARPWDAPPGRPGGRLAVREVPTPRPGPHEVLLRVAAVGLCGTDWHIFAGHGNYHRDERGRPIPLAREPQILGHEIAGIVEATGADVHDLRPGDRVVVDQGRSCVSEGRSPACEYCASGDSHQCEQYQEHGITGLPGGLAEYLAIPAVNAARIEAEPNAAKPALAERFGAETIDPTAVDLVDAVLARTCGRRVELLVEASGSGTMLASIAPLVRKQATVLLYGHGHAGVDVSVLSQF